MILNDLRQSSVLGLWRSDFGNRYHRDNITSREQTARRMELWSRILAPTDTYFHAEKPPKVILEFGAGMGNNILALRKLWPNIDFLAVEPNANAADELRKMMVEVDECPAHETVFSNHCADLTLTSGVLIHVHPDDLLESMSRIYDTSRRWIACIEYYAKDPEVKTWRGKPALFKRDWGNYWLDNFDLECVSYGFTWKRMEGVDDANWYLFRKR